MNCFRMPLCYYVIYSIIVAALSFKNSAASANTIDFRFFNLVLKLASILAVYCLIMF